MISKNGLGSELNRLVKAISSVEGVIGIVLFGSRARGDYEESSDYDLLVIFEGDEIMRRKRMELYGKVGELKLFAQILTRSLRELKEATEPTFLEKVLKEGRLLYARAPLEFPALSVALTPMAMISYDLRGLTHREKLRVAYRLFGRRTASREYRGIVDEVGGRRLGSGCVLVPEGGAKRVLALLDAHRAKYEVIKAFLPAPTIDPRCLS